MEKKKPPKCTLTFVPLLLQAPQKVFAIVTPVEAFICMNLKFQSNIYSKTIYCIKSKYNRAIYVLLRAIPTSYPGSLGPFILRSIQPRSI